MRMKPSRRRARTAHVRISVLAQSLEPRCLLSIGELAPSYGEGGIARVEFNPHSGGIATAVEALPDGRAYVAAWDSLDFSLARLTFDGDLDPTFGTGGKAHVHLSNSSQQDQANDMVVQPDGKIVVGGSSGIDFGLVRYLPDGTLDPSFGTGGIVHTPAQSFSGPLSGVLKGLIRQDDGKIVALGSSYNGSRDRATVARYNPDGSIDATFGLKVFDLATRVGQPAFGSSFSDGLMLPDGSLLLSGSAWSAVLVKLTARGVIDTTFADRGVAHDATFPYQVADSVTAAPGGSYYTVVGNSAYAAGVTRWNSDGSIDHSFGTAGAAPLTTGFYAPSDIHVQPDGTVVASAGVYRTTTTLLKGFEWATFSS